MSVFNFSGITAELVAGAAEQLRQELPTFMESAKEHIAKINITSLVQSSLEQAQSANIQPLFDEIRMQTTLLTKEVFAETEKLAVVTAEKLSYVFVTQAVLPTCAIALGTVCAGLLIWRLSRRCC